jgi:hypothetical protein
MSADLVGTLGGDFAKGIVERSTAMMFGALTSRLSARRAKSKGEDGGSVEERKAAYDDFRCAVVEYRTEFGILAFGPPSLVGALWTYPLHMRLLHRHSRRAAAVVNSLLALEVVGRDSTRLAAEQVLLQITVVNDAYATAFGP